MTTEIATRPTTAPEAPSVEPAETTKPMKLSEAMRLGSIDTVQAYGTWSDTNAEGEATMCAMSTAWYALTGGKANDAQGSALYRLLEDTTVIHPVDGGPVPISSAIIDLNDAKKWSRPKIADWLESLGL